MSDCSVFTQSKSITIELKRFISIPKEMLKDTYELEFKNSEFEIEGKHIRNVDI